MRDFLQIFGSFVNFVFGLFGVLLGLRLIMRLFSANSANGFVEWIYETSRPLIEPFENIFPTVQLEDGFVLEVSTLFALVIYGLAAALIVSLLDNLAASNAPTKKRK